MRVLGIHGWFHDSNVALVEDGNVLTAMQHERVTRKKHDGSFPIETANEIIKDAGVGVVDINNIALPISPFWDFVKESKVYTKHAPWLTKRVLFEGNKFKYIGLRAIRFLRLKRHLKKIGLENVPISFIPHHICHTSSAYMMSGFDKALIFTFDAEGDWLSGSVSIGDKSEITKVKDFTVAQSLGIFYSSITRICGMRAMDEEWKIMGLAPYGKFDPSKYENIIKLNFDKENIISPDIRNHTIFFKKLLQKPQTFEEKAEVASWGQWLLEEIATKTIQHFMDEYKIYNVCIGGGVGLNTKMNQRIKDNTEAKDIFIIPEPGDAGLALGAALEVCRLNGMKNNKKLDSVYWGTFYSNQMINDELKNHQQLNFEENSDVSRFAAEEISKGRIIAWYNGNMEWGPRALGNRSILADPSDPKMKDKVNNLVKYREGWRPFASSILNESLKDFVVNPVEAPFMIMTFDVIEERKKDILSVVHVDGTTRPQTVRRKQNPKYYDLINEFKKISGIPMALNTFFNLRGEPIVRSPADAISTFMRSNMDYLILGDYVVTKK